MKRNNHRSIFVLIMIVTFCITRLEAQTDTTAFVKEYHCSDMVLFLKRGGTIFEKRVYINNNSYIYIKYQQEKLFETGFMIDKGIFGIKRTYNENGDLSATFYSEECLYTVSGTESYSDFYKKITSIKNLKITFNTKTAMPTQITYFMNDELKVMNIDEMGLVK